MSSGTTSGTGALPQIAGKSFMCKLDFGSGSVDLEQRMPSGNWIKIDTAITADYSKVAEFPAGTALRFNVTAHVSAIEWEITTGLDG